MAERGSSIGRLLLIVFVLGGLSGCSEVNLNANLEPASNQTLEYYPGLVKGFEHTYPSRRILVLMVTDACRAGSQASGQASAPGQEVGLTLDARGKTIQRLYAMNMATIVQKAIEQAAREAGMISFTSSNAHYTAQPTAADYVLEGKVVRCWVKKQRVVDNDKESSWQTVADFAIAATIYKPPFSVPFWQGTSTETYSDPPDNSGPISEDQASIYDEPGQVLSVAFTRCVEGIFKRNDLHSLIAQDRALRH